ncbi:MAG: hypothetical protein ABIR68_14180 [Ilumatobacteraceae bacterium]
MPSRRALLLPLCALFLAGCFTGKRPSFREDTFGVGTTTGDAAIDAVLAKLDLATTTPPTFTAGYDIVVRFGNVPKTATVVVDGVNEAVTMHDNTNGGDVRLLQTAAGAQTCRGSICASGLDETALSDTQLTSTFWAADIAKRLRFDAASKIGPTAQRTEQVGGQTASCVDVVQANNTASYCVLDDGVLARLTDADVYITLMSFATTADPTAFSPPA